MGSTAKRRTLASRGCSQPKKTRACSSSHAGETAATRAANSSCWSFVSSSTTSSSSCGLEGSCTYCAGCMWCIQVCSTLWRTVKWPAAAFGPVLLAASTASVFLVCCYCCLRIGSEREACLQLLQKCYNMAERGTPLAIKSAVCLDHLKGFFYIEAFRDSHVSACRALQRLQCAAAMATGAAATMAVAAVLVSAVGHVGEAHACSKSGVENEQRLSFSSLAMGVACLLVQES